MAQNTVIIPVRNVFKQSHLISIGQHEHISFNRDETNCHEYRVWESYLNHGWRFAETPGGGNCGIWALIISLEAVLSARFGIHLDLKKAWAALEGYFRGYEYWVDVMEILARHPAPDTMDFEITTNFDSYQLHLFCRYLMRNLRDLTVGPEPVLAVNFRPEVDVEIIFIHHIQIGQPPHDIVRVHRIGDPPQREAIFIYIHHSHIHYQAFTNKRWSLTEQDVERDFEWEELPGSKSGRRYDGPNKGVKYPKPEVPKPKKQNPTLPKDDKFLWIIARWPYANPWTGENTLPLKNPYTNSQLQQYFGVGEPSVVRKRKEKALKKYNLPRDESTRSLGRRRQEEATRAAKRRAEDETEDEASDDVDKHPSKKRRIPSKTRSMATLATQDNSSSELSSPASKTPEWPESSPEGPRRPHTRSQDKEVSKALAQSSPASQRQTDRFQAQKNAPTRSSEISEPPAISQVPVSRQQRPMPKLSPPVPKKPAQTQSQQGGSGSFQANLHDPRPARAHGQIPGGQGKSPNKSFAVPETGSMSVQGQTPRPHRQQQRSEMRPLVAVTSPGGLQFQAYTESGALPQSQMPQVQQQQLATPEDRLRSDLQRYAHPSMPTYYLSNLQMTFLTNLGFNPVPGTLNGSQISALNNHMDFFSRTWQMQSGVFGSVLSSSGNEGAPRQEFSAQAQGISEQNIDPDLRDAVPPYEQPSISQEQEPGAEPTTSSSRDHSDSNLKKLFDDMIAFSSSSREGSAEKRKPSGSPGDKKP